MYPHKAQHIHLIGIGGIGMSGIAEFLHQKGYRISGCDLDIHQKSVSSLMQSGCTIYHGNNTEQCHDTSIDIIVYSSAVAPDAPEITFARSRGIPIIQRASMLAEIMRTKFSIAISGSHGKTTTTSLIGQILYEAQLDPTIVVGGHVTSMPSLTTSPIPLSHRDASNVRVGNGEFIVAEADESDKSFLKLYPTWAVVTNISFEHVDVYKTIEEVRQTFVQFLEHLPFYGKAFLCAEDPQIALLLPLCQAKIVLYGTSPHADIQARDIILGAHYSICTIWQKGAAKPLGSLYLTMPGQHNILNATAAVAVGLELGIPFDSIHRALAQFKGVDRRFSSRGTFKGIELFDDYAHHPCEIHQALLVARKRAHNKLIVAFQLHRYSRTQRLWDDFIKVFQNHPIDHLIITDIYAAHEKSIEGITGEQLAHAISLTNANPTQYIPADTEWSCLQKYLTEIASEGDLILFLGAGRINKAAELLQRSLIPS